MAVKTAKPVNRIATNGVASKFNFAPSESLFELERLSIKVVGMSPLLCHNPASMKAASPDTTRTKSKIPSPEEEAKAGLYVDEDGDYAFPNGALYSALVTSAELLKLKAGSGRMAPSVAGILMGGLGTDHNVRAVKLLDPETMNPLKSYEVDLQRVVIPSSGSSVIRARPRFDKWAAIFQLQLDTGDPNLMAVLNEHLPVIFRHCGVRVGLGDGRAYVRKLKGKPSFGGPFGKFTAEVM